MLTGYRKGASIKNCTSKSSIYVKYELSYKNLVLLCKATFINRVLYAHMKMRCAYILGVVLLLLLASCAKPECSKASDCTAKSAPGFIVSCTDGKCAYAPLANVCGNNKCELEIGEDQNTCASDCGACEGKVKDKQYLEYQLVNNKCVQGVPARIVRPLSSVNDISNAGDKFHIQSSYSQPFNLKKDLFTVAIRLEQGPQNRDERIIDVELSGMTKDRRKLVLGRKDINRPLWEGVELNEGLILDFPAFEVENELNSLVLKVRYEYGVLQGDKPVRKESSFNVNYREKFLFVNPVSKYPCPASCDDLKPGTRDFCDSQTSFCKHEPLPGACGNSVCETNENKCACVADCGTCAGGGSFTQESCKGSQCVASLRPSVIVTPNNIFETRDLGPVELSMNYKFSAPFDTTKDVFTIYVVQQRADTEVSKVTIKTVRLLEGAQVIAESQVNKEVGQTPITFSITVPSQSVAEDERTITAAIGYSYVKNEKVQEGVFQKPLGKLVLVSPG